MKLLIRADAGGLLGTGHVMRMLALGQAWQDSGGDVCLAAVSCPDAVADRLTAENVRFKRLQAEEPGDEADLASVLELSAELEPDWMVLDGYHFGTGYQRAVHEAGLSLMCVDDYGHCDTWCADVMLNQNIGEENRVYDNEVPDAHTLTGCGYAMLRREFREPGPQGADDDRAPGPSRLLVTLGGVDADNVTASVLRALADVPQTDLTVRAVVGPGNPHAEDLRQLAAASPFTVELVQNVKDMPGLYRWADGIISAGGSSCYEWLRYGLQGAVIRIAENQRVIVDTLAERGLAVDLTSYLMQGPTEKAGRLEQFVGQLTSQKKVEPRVVDGFGACRVAEQLQEAG